MEHDRAHRTSRRAVIQVLVNGTRQRHAATPPIDSHLDRDVGRTRVLGGAFSNLTAGSEWAASADLAPRAARFVDQREQTEARTLYARTDTSVPQAHCTLPDSEGNTKLAKLR
jgi:hypothetical protein